MENGKFTPAVELTYMDQADLAATCATPGYGILHRLMRSEVDKFVLALINTEQGDKEEVYSAFLVSKAAAQFYQGVTNRINQEVIQYTASQGRDSSPIDGTEGILDIGELASNSQDFATQPEEDGIIHD